MILLSILIPSLNERADMLAVLLRKLEQQIESCEAKDKVEICVSIDDKERTTGSKRNELMSLAKGEYLIGHDDDDDPPSWYIEELLIACKSGADCFAISGVITTDGKDEKRWFISKDLDYKAIVDSDGRGAYHRYTNHITAVRRDIALQIKFPDQVFGEDYQWATDLKNSGLLKTEYKIDRFPMYHYKFSRKLTKQTAYYSQNNEDEIVSNFFGQFVGTMLEIGANDGQTLSQSLHFISKNWKAALVEPSPKVFKDLLWRHQHNENVYCYGVAIGDKNGKVTLHDSGELLGRGDKALVSTVNVEETKRWTSMNMPFEQIEVDMVTWDTFMEICPYKTYDYISIDAEGCDWSILKQMDLDKLGCMVLCIEHNSLPNLISQYSQYVEPLGFQKLAINGENIIFCRR